MPLKRANPALGEPAHVADLDQQLGDRACSDRTARPASIRSLDERLELFGYLPLLAIERLDLRGVVVEQLQAQAVGAS